MGRTSKVPILRLILLVLCGLAFCRTRSDAATNALFKGRTGTTTTTTTGSSSRDQAPHVSSAASSLSRESSSLAAAPATARDVIPTFPEEEDAAAADDDETTARGGEGGVSQKGGEGGDSQEAAAAASGGSNSGGGGGGGSNNSDEDDNNNNNNNNSTLQRDFRPNDGAAAGVLPDTDADAGVDRPAAGAGGGASSGSAAAAAALAARVKAKAAEAWGRLEVGVERVIHVRREVKAVFSSELERCLLKATRPENIAVDEDCMLALLTQANRLAAVKACCDCDPHEVVCSKLRKKIMEQDWRTVVKALYVVHRLQRDSPAMEAARFSAFIKDQWAEGAGELGKHMRTDGGVYAPWLKVYCGYLATRGLRLEAATNAFRSWETLTSTRQLRNALTETNALLAGALALHFAGDASGGGRGGGGEAVRAACCALAFQDVADVRAMLCGTGAPPALLGVLRVGDESPGKSQPSGAPEEEGERGLAQGVPQHECGVTSAEIATPGEGDEVLGDAGAGGGDAPSRDGEEGGEEEEEVEAAAVAVRDMPEDVLKVAKECVVYEDVSGVITAVYAARYGTDAAGKAPAVPLWVRQMASLARLAGRTDAAAAAASAGGSGDGSDPHPNDGGPSTLVGGNGGAAAAAAEGDGAHAVSGAGAGAGSTEEGARGIDSSNGLRGGGVRYCWRTPAAGNIAVRGHRRGGCSFAEGGTAAREGLRRGGGFLPVLAARSRRGVLVGRAADVARRLRGGG
ncbi:unnamed protein product [Ectocarpus sp. CCAP 1310/34]|nr:unnamed protein product [Ectocarpus sp. CCAP 1310/34]